MIDYLKRVQGALSNPMMLMNPNVMSDLLRETNAHIEESGKFSAMMSKMKGLQLNQNEQNLLTSVAIMLQGKLNPDQSGQANSQALGKIPVIQMPFKPNGGVNVRG